MNRPEKEYATGKVPKITRRTRRDSVQIRGSKGNTKRGQDSVPTRLLQRRTGGAADSSLRIDSDEKRGQLVRGHASVLVGDFGLLR